MHIIAEPASRQPQLLMLSGRVALVTGGARGERDCCDACWLQICNIQLDIEEREHLQAFRGALLAAAVAAAAASNGADA